MPHRKEARPMKSTPTNTAIFSRRDLIRTSAVAGASGILATSITASTRLPQRGGGPGIYEEIGVRPFINCTSDRTINGGSEALP
jgi:hypothetical protein